MKPSPRPLLCVLIALFLPAPAFAQEGDWCGTPPAGPAPVIPASFRSSGQSPPIPVVFHIVYKTRSNGTEVGNLPDSQIEAQLATLNDRFAATGISFSLLGISRIENGGWYDDMVPAYHQEIGSLVGVDQHRVMNVYVGYDSNYAGAAIIPDSTGDVVGTASDGLFVNALYFPSSSRAGEVAVHEAGHYLGLQHTWGTSDQAGGSCSVDDGFTDTGNHASPNWGNACFENPLPNGCVDEPVDLPDPVHNFMNYTSEVCRDEFTGEQNDRQVDIRNFVRGELGQDVPTVYDARSGPVTLANPTFSGESVYVLPGADVTVTGTVTLLNGARFVAVGSSALGGVNLGGVTGLDLQDGSLFDVRAYDGSLAFSDDVTVAGGSVFRLGQEGGDLARGVSTFPGTPPLAVAGNVSVSGPGSAFEMKGGSTFTLGASSVARFEDGGLYVMEGGTALGSYSQFVFEPDAAAPEITRGYADPTFALGRDARLVFRNGGYTLGGDLLFSVGRLDPNAAWDYVAFEGNNLTLRNARIEGGKTGVYVRAKGVTLDHITVTGNTYGLRSDFAGGGCTTTGCSLQEPAEFAITNSAFEGNTAYGLYIRNTAVASLNTTIIRDNTHGLLVSSASNVRLHDNLLAENAADGLRVGGGTNVYLAHPFHYYGSNRITDNGDDEVVVASGGYLYVDTAPGTGNVIMKGCGPGSGHYLIDVLLDANEAPIRAESVYWGSANGPPAEAFSDPFLVDAVPDLGTDPDGIPLACNGGSYDTEGVAAAQVGPGGPSAPDGFAARSSLDAPEFDTPVLSASGVAEAAGRGTTGRGTTGRGTTGRGTTGGGTTGPDRDLRTWLRQQIREARQGVESAPDAPGAVRLLRRLYYLQRLDHDDELGEHGPTMRALERLRRRLGGGQGLPALLRRTAEAALRAEVHDALLRAEYATAEGLLGEYGSLVEDEDERRALALARVVVHEQAGRYAEALATLEAVIAALPEEDGDLAADLGLMASVIAEHLSDAGRPASDPSVTAVGTQNDVIASPRAFVLGAAYPNPFGGATVVPFEIPESAEVHVAVYDLLGREVARLAEGRREAGRYRIRFEARGFAAGVYVVRAVMTPEKSSVVRTFSQKLTVVR